jgi:ribonuclease D
LWQARDGIARERDLSPGRVLPDRAVVEAALTDPPDDVELVKLPVFRGRAQRRLATTWAEALRTARTLPRTELPDPTPPHDGPPPPSRWADKDPDAAARLAVARAGLIEIAETHTLPVENLLQPDLVRRTCWEPPTTLDESAVADVLRAGGARNWQIELTVAVLTEALRHSAAHGDVTGPTE